MAKVSIIVPVYNTEAYLPQCIESLLSQTLEDIEIILVNDGSPDRCRQICDEYVQRDGRVIAVHKENEGVSIARNIGIERSTGEWICFIDSDDWVAPDMCSGAVSYAEANDLDMLAYNSYSNYGNNQVKCADIAQCIFDTTGIELFQLCLVSSHYFNSKHDIQLGAVGGSPKKIYRGDLLRQSDARFIKELTRGEDIVFNLYLSEDFKRIGFINEFWYHYRTHADQTTQAYQKDLPEVSLLFFENIRAYIDKYHKNSDEFEAAYNLSVLRTLNNICFQHYFHKENPAKLSARLRGLKQLTMTEPFNTALKNADTSHFRLDDKLFSIFLRKRMTLPVWMLCKCWRILYVLVRGKI